MKIIKNLFITIVTCIIFTSCYSTTYAQDNVYSNDIEEVSYYTIITYGRPVYIDNVINYYIYNGIYYYPYIWNNHRYFYPHRTIMGIGYQYVPSRMHHPYNNLGDNYQLRPRRNYSPNVINDRSRYHIGNRTMHNSSTRGHTPGIRNSQRLHRK